MIKLDYTTVVSLVVTIFHIVVLYAFMSRLFFKPSARVLKERRQLILDKA
jgi:F0F1-type ATP synthase membrane subunit b/b'